MVEGRGGKERGGGEARVRTGLHTLASTRCLQRPASLTLQPLKRLTRRAVEMVTSP